MKRFDVYSTRRVRESEGLLVLQGQRFLDLDTVVIAPLFRADRFRPVEEINPIVELNGVSLILKLEGLTSVPSGLLTRCSGNLSDFAYNIQNALDRLFGGY